MASGAAQRLIGLGQIISGLLYAGYGGSYGGSGGGTYLIGSGIANVSGSKYGSARRGTKGFYQDLYGSLGAAGASMGIGGGSKRSSVDDASYNTTPFLKDILNPPTNYIDMQQQSDPTSEGYWWSDGLSGGAPYMMQQDQQATDSGSHVFDGLRKLLLGEYA